MVLVVSNVTAVSNVWLFGEYMCAITGFSVTMARILVLVMFVIDRFLSVFCPYYYPRHNKQIMVTLSIACWVIAVGFATPSMLDC
jgi:hypothetical protein